MGKDNTMAGKQAEYSGGRNKVLDAKTESE